MSAKSRFLKAFEELWAELFSSPVHLDSALSKRPADVKPWLAQFVPKILLTPVSLGEALGVGIAPGEPWTAKNLESWRPALQMADRLYDLQVCERPSPIPEFEPTEADFPPALIRAWRESFGDEVAKNLARDLAIEAPLTLRAAGRTSPQQLLAELKKTELLPRSTRATEFSPLGVELPRYAPVMKTEAFERGAFEIQDEGSQLLSVFALWPESVAPLLARAPGRPGGSAVEIPSPRPGGAFQLVDACAGAGGKTLALADLLRGKGRVFAYDTSDRKLQALRKRATRAGYNNIQVHAVEEGAESSVVSRFENSADLVLIDAPCSGWGVLRRNPDIKWRQDEKALDRLPALQLRLLGEYSRLVKRGGRLVYGTCTFRREETLEISRRFLDENPEFQLQSEGFLGPGPMDGFFMNSMARKT